MYHSVLEGELTDPNMGMTFKGKIVLPIFTAVNKTKTQMCAAYLIKLVAIQNCKINKIIIVYMREKVRGSHSSFQSIAMVFLFRL